MKFSIHGFFQPRAVELGLTNDDLLVLRWFVDFAGTNKMQTIIVQNEIFYWVNYATILEDLPILNISKDWLRRKVFKKLCKAKVLKHKHIKKGGRFSYYTYDFNYDTLIYLQDTSSTRNNTQGYGENNATHTDNNTQGYGENNATHTDNNTQVYGENNATKINLLNNQSINNSSINNTYNDELKNSPAKAEPIIETDNQKIIDNVINKLNELTGSKFKGTTKTTKDYINGRLANGYTEQDLLLVVEKMCYLWNKEPEKGQLDMREYLRPSTLFAPTNFENYFNKPVPKKKPTTRDIQDKIDFSDF